MIIDLMMVIHSNDNNWSSSNNSNNNNNHCNRRRCNHDDVGCMNEFNIASSASRVCWCGNYELV